MFSLSKGYPHFIKKIIRLKFKVNYHRFSKFVAITFLKRYYTMSLPSKEVRPLRHAWSLVPAVAVTTTCRMPHSHPPEQHFYQKLLFCTLMSRFLAGNAI